MTNSSAAPEMDVLLVYASSVYASTGVFELFLLTALLLWYFNPSLRALMDVISTHFLHKWTPDWESRRTVQSSAGLRHKMTQGHHRVKERLAVERVVDQAIKKDGLLSIKENEWNLLERKEPRPAPQLSCSNCTPSQRPKASNVSSDRIVNILDVRSLDTAPKNWLSYFAPDLVHCCTFKKFDYQYIQDTVLEDENVKEAVEGAARDIAKELNLDDADMFSKILDRQWSRAKAVLTNLRSTLSDIIIRLSGWVFLKTLPIMFSSMSASASQIAMLRKASETGLPLIFLPLHRSHMDYIAVTLTLCVNNIRSPLVASGENLRIPVFGWILRGLGAFFIKRRMDPISGKKDQVYRAVLQTYLNQCMSANHWFEFFIEGRRSRTGKPCMPKGGLLSIFIDAYLSGVLQDALLVPVSVNFERLVDDSFLGELSGAPKAPESFSSTVSAIWSSMTTKYGHIRIDFSQPFSLNELVRSFQNKVKQVGSGNGQALHVAPSTASLYGTDIVVEEQRQLVDSIARHILYDCVQTTSVMSTNAVSFLLLYKFREGVYIGTLVEALDQLLHDLRAAGKDVGFTGDSFDVINHVVNLLGPGLIKRESKPDGDFLVPVTMLPNLLELSYYSNILLPHFILNSVVGVSAAVLEMETLDGKVYHDKLIETCHSLCKILQFEFLFTKPCQNLNDALFDVVDSFLIKDVFNTVQAPHRRGRLDGRNMDIIDDSYDYDDEFSNVPIITYKISSPETISYLKAMTRSIIDTYSITGHCLGILVSAPQTEREFVKYVLAQVKTRLDNNTITYGESVSTETITNCIRLFEKLKVLDGYYQDGVKLLALSSQYENPDFLEPVQKMITRFQL